MLGWQLVMFGLSGSVECVCDVYTAKTLMLTHACFCAFQFVLKQLAHVTLN